MTMRVLTILLLAGSGVASPPPVPARVKDLLEMAAAGPHSDS